MLRDELCCRICYDGPQEVDSGKECRMVSPCGCSGSSSHIHVDCLKKLYLSRRNTEDRLRCPTCLEKYDVTSSLMLANFDLKRLTRLRSKQRAFDADSTQEIADTYSTMANVFCDMGRYQTALDCNDLDLTIKQATLGSAHPAFAKSLNNKGLTLCKQNKYIESKECFTRANEIYERVNGRNSPQVASVLANLSLLHCNMGDCDKALQLLDRCIQILQSNQSGYMDAKHNVRLNIAKMNRSVLLVRMNRLDEAEQVARVCLDYGRRALSKTSPELIQWEGVLEMILKKKGDRDILKPLVQISLVPASQKMCGGGQAPRCRPVTPAVCLVEGNRPSKRVKVEE